MNDIDTALAPLAIVLDDEPLIAWDLAELLVGAGYSVEVFVEADDAVRAIRTRSVALVVLDMALADGSTSEAAAGAAAVAGVPVVFCSGSSLPSNLTGAAFVPKPYSRETLLAGVDAAMRQPLHAALRTDERSSI